MITDCIHSTMFLGRSTILSIIAVVGVLGLSVADAQAGVILPWTQESAAIDFSLPLEGAGSSSAPEPPVSDSQKQRESDHKPLAGIRAIDGLAETGGASSPVNHFTGSAGVPVVAVLDAPATSPVVRSFKYLRETTPQLPQPPLGELLDPPKACA